MPVRPRHAARARRRAALVSLSGRQGYDGAQTTRLTGNWFPGGLDFNALVSQASPHLRARVRDLVRNFPPFSRAVNGIVAFTIGRGSRFQSLALTPDGEPDHAVRRRIEDRFRTWMDKADVTGKLHFYELQQLAKRQECECGEYVGRFAAPRGRGRHPVAVQMYEAENLSAWHFKGQGRDTDIFQGVEYDVHTGEPVAYHFQTSYQWQMVERWREPAENVLHGFHLLRPGQLRGVTPFAPAVMLARDMGDYAGAEIDAAKMAAKYLGIVKSGDPAMFQAMRGMTPGASGHGRRPEIEWMENAVIEYLNEGEDITFAPGSQRPGDSFDRFTRFVLRMVAITMDLPYEILSGDYTGINYSTSKASRNDFSMFLVPHQFRLEAHFIRPVFHRWLDHEALTQDYLRGYWLNPWRYRKAMWIPAGMPSVDPLRDGKADIDAIASGIKSPQEVILGRGHDPEEVVAQRAAWRDLCEEYGLDASTGGVSTSLAHNPAKLGAVEELAPVTDDPEKDAQQPNFEG
jgi:lambda family phage portal protein